MSNSVAPKTGEQPVLLGALRGAYGLKGCVRVQPFQGTEALLSCRQWILRTPEGECSPLVVEQARAHGPGLIAKFAGIDTPEAAAALKGAVCMRRQDFPPIENGEYYWVDLIGCEVKNTEGQSLGRVKSVADNGAHDYLDVVSATGSSTLIPFVDSYIQDVNLVDQVITVEWGADW